MTKLLYTLCFLIVVTIAKGQSTIPKEAFNFSRFKPISLPSPNSGTFSFEQAEKRKNEIYNLQLTPKYFAWKNPTLGGAVHINKNDEIEVYQFTIGVFLYKNDTGVYHDINQKDTFIVLKNIEDLHYHVGGVGFGNPASVLITSEISLDKSEAIKKLMKELWKSGVQIFYLTKNE